MIIISGGSLESQNPYPRTRRWAILSALKLTSRNSGGI